MLHGGSGALLLWLESYLSHVYLFWYSTATS